MTNVGGTAGPRVGAAVEGGEGQRRAALQFVVLIGVVSLFADLTYEGARSITGPYLAVLGATATVVGIVTGLGELLGYGLRLVAGRFTDRWGAYWPVTIVGYVVQMASVPALALATSWPVAAALIVAERIGKGVRNPPRDAMLARAGQAIGRGWAFGLHEALDQLGAMVGPLVVAGVLAVDGRYPAAFAALLVSAVLTLASLAAARLTYPQPPGLAALRVDLHGAGLPDPYWLYLAAAAFVAAGFADFSLIAFHFERHRIVDPALIPVFYAAAMGAGGMAAPVMGRLFDRIGIGLLVPLTVVGAGVAPLAFLGGPLAGLLGAVLWGGSLSVHESVMAAAVAEMVPPSRTASAYGIFTMAFGVAWFLGSAVLGILYDRSIPLMVLAAVLLQLVAVPILVLVGRRPGRQAGTPSVAAP